MFVMMHCKNYTTVVTESPVGLCEVFTVKLESLRSSNGLYSPLVPTDTALDFAAD